MKARACRAVSLLLVPPPSGVVSTDWPGVAVVRTWLKRRAMCFEVCACVWVELSGVCRLSNEWQQGQKRTGQESRPTVSLRVSPWPTSLFCCVKLERGHCWCPSDQLGVSSRGGGFTQVTRRTHGPDGREETSSEGRRGERGDGRRGLFL
jgi:hypothetical protein